MTFQTRVESDPPKPATTKNVTVEDLMAKAFTPARQLRSPEYQAGVRNMLSHHIEGSELVVPYPLGTAQADAFFAGWDEGKAIWRRITG